MTKISQAEYIWLDGNKTQNLRSKTRILEFNNDVCSLENFPMWSYDGSSTKQSTGENSDLILKPVCFYDDPIRGQGNYLVLCEVYQGNDPHETNTRSQLRRSLDKLSSEVDPWIGFEQEYTFFYNNLPLGWPEKGEPEPQGPYYCGVGSDKIHGRNIVEEHTIACLDAGIAIYGTNAEVMPSQWEFQIGYRGFKDDNLDILKISDELWISRWLLLRISEKYNVTVSFSNKPIAGDWNGSGCHTNFSTNRTRDKNQGLAAIQDAIKLLEEEHKSHIKVYGEGLADRLTGLHETCSIHEFKSGVSNRGASIRIPESVKNNGYGYFEDRRPGANCDPYLVANKLIETVCL